MTLREHVADFDSTTEHYAQVGKPLKFSRFGADDGRIVIYFHGAPGTPEECCIFDQEGKNHGLTFICLDRFSVDPSIDGEAYYKHLASEISKIACGKRVDVIGFSIGAFVALQTVRYMADGIGSLHLISAAAPLETGDYLETMAGKRVFKLVKSAPALFVLMSYWQSLLARFCPAALFRLLFASAAGEDKALAASREFRSGIIDLLKACFISRVKGYTRDLRLYVQPGQTTLAEISVNTYVWHGAEDNWSPPMMAEYFRSALPGYTSSNIYDGLSRYSRLYQAVPEICNLLDRA